MTYGCQQYDPQRLCRYDRRAIDRRCDGCPMITDREYLESMSLWIHGTSHIDKACSSNGERKNEMYKQRGSSDVGFIFGLALVVWIVSAWITHVVVCLKTDAWGFLIAGAIMFPVAVIHGTGVWIGIW